MFVPMSNNAQELLYFTGVGKHISECGGIVQAYSPCSSMGFYPQHYACKKKMRRGRKKRREGGKKPIRQAEHT